MDTEVQRAFLTLRRAGIKLRVAPRSKPTMWLHHNRYGVWRARFTDWEGRSYRYSGFSDTTESAPSLFAVHCGEDPLDFDRLGLPAHVFRNWIISLNFPTVPAHIVKRGQIGPLGRVARFDYQTHDFDPNNPEHDVHFTGSYSDCEISRHGLRQLRPSLLVYTVDRLPNYTAPFDPS